MRFRTIAANQFDKSMPRHKVTKSETMNTTKCFAGTLGWFVLFCGLSFQAGRLSRVLLEQRRSLPLIRTLLDFVEHAFDPLGTQPRPAEGTVTSEQWLIDVFHGEDPSRASTITQEVLDALELNGTLQTCSNASHSCNCIALLDAVGHVSVIVSPLMILIDILAIADALDFEDVTQFLRSITNKREPDFRWAMKHRGFGHAYDNPEANEYDNALIGRLTLDHKKYVIGIESDFQSVDVFDLMEPRHQRLSCYHQSLSGDNSYQAVNPDLFQPDRLVFMDEVLQSRRRGEAAYHESLVHPALTVVRKEKTPKAVAIVGGGEGATLREVLKHRWVERAVMIEIDEAAVNLAREYLPEWSNCSEIIGSEDSCFNDPRAQVTYEDAIAWFIDRYGRQADPSDDDKFNVIIMDALDPSSVVEFSDFLYKSDELAFALSNALTTNGILVVQVGEYQSFSDAPPQYQRNGDVVISSFMPLLKKHGFVKARTYEDFHGGLGSPWEYNAYFKDNATSKAWLANEAVVNLEITKRLASSKSGQSLLHYFDGATMQSFMYPSRADEEAHCRATPKPVFCEQGHGFDPERPHTSSLDIGKVTHALNVSFLNGSYVALDSSVHSIVLPLQSGKILKQVNATAAFFLEAISDQVDTFIDCSVLAVLETEPHSMIRATYEYPNDDCFWHPFVDRNLAMRYFGGQRASADL